MSFLYGKKILRHAMNQRVERGKETSDAVLWDIVDETRGQCRIKIQGSGELVVAHYPRNWKQQPYWLKPGNAVRVLHRAGVRGYIEVIGEGRAIPLPVEGAALPDPPALPDMIITGLELLPTSPASWAVIITDGTYRIGGQYYLFTAELIGGAIVMNDPAPMIMGSSTVMMGRVEYTVALDAAPAAGYYRYDAFCIGIDGVVDYLKGTEVRTNPIQPTITSGHLQIGQYILVLGGGTEIDEFHIGAVWSAAVPTTLEITASETFAWSGITDTPEMNVAVQVKDQYGQNVTTSAGGFTLKLEKLIGTGMVWSLETGYHADLVQQANNGAYTFKYQRDQTVTESSPLLQATLVNHSECFGWAPITLLDVGGDPI